MIRIVNIGMNHETAPVELRECLAGDPEQDVRTLTAMLAMEEIKEAFFLSTCNRAEVLFTTEQSESAERRVQALLCKLAGVDQERLLASLFVYEGREAVRHVFRVASSLDSMVVGEPQILGQIKDAYAHTTRQKASGVILNRLMHRAFHVAKRIRTETGVSDAAVSISYAAVELAKKIFYDLQGKRVLLIGAGEMAELAARHLLAQGVGSMAVANRTFERAVTVARAFDAHPVSFEELEGELVGADIVISSTASPGFVLNVKQVRATLRRRRGRPLFLIDIAVPRDVDPGINGLENVYVYDIDDLQGLVALNVENRRQEAIRAERIVSEEVLKFDRWLETLAVVPTIVALREKAEAIVTNELQKSGAALADLSGEQREALRILTRSIVEKILTDPILLLKRKAGRDTLNQYLDTARQLFNLDEEA